MCSALVPLVYLKMGISGNHSLRHQKCQPNPTKFESCIVVCPINAHQHTFYQIGTAVLE